MFLLKTKARYNAIIAIICRLTKRRILESIVAIEKGTDAKAIAKIVYLSIRRQGVGIINTFILNKGS